MLTSAINNTVAFIPSAGLGTRLMPLTRSKPKALVSFMGKTMLENTISRLSALGISRFIVNVHHFTNQMNGYISNLREHYNIAVSDESDQLLDTGGGLYNISDLLKPNEKTVLVHNVDVYANVPLKKLLETHFAGHADATLAVSDRRSSRKLIFNNNRLCGWKNIKTGEILGQNSGDKVKTWAFSGIHVVNRTIFEHRPPEKVFPLIKWYVNLAQQKHFEAWKHSPNEWFDLGTVRKMEHAERALKKA